MPWFQLSEKCSNKALEAIAQAIFKDWFVDFGPVHAEVAGRDPSLPDNISTLFPDKLAGSEIGEIPEGWKVKPFTSFLEILYGGTPKTSESSYWSGEIPWCTIADVKSNGIWLTQTQKSITDRGLENSAAKLLPKKSGNRNRQRNCRRSCHCGQRDDYQSILLCVTSIAADL